MQEFHHPSTHFTGCLHPQYTGWQHPTYRCLHPGRGGSTPYGVLAFTMWGVSAQPIGGV